jgi:hypothetical protein
MALNISYAIEAFDRYSKTMDKLDRNLNKLQNRRDIKIGVIITGIPALAPMIATATAAVGGLSSSFASAGVGVAAFSSLAVTALNDVYAASEDIAKINDKLAVVKGAEERNKLLQKKADIMSQLSDNQKRALKSLQAFSAFWGKFAKQFEKPVVDIFVQSLGMLERGIKRLEPAFKGSVSAVAGLMNRLNEAMKQPDMQRFIDMINNRAGPALENWGRIFGNVIRGVMNLMVAFNPTAKKMENGLLGMTQRFVKWSQKVGQSKGFKQFINYVQTNGPIVLSFIGRLVKFIVNLIKAMAPVGTITLKIANAFLQFSNRMLTAYPIIGYVIAGIFSLIGVMKLLLPVIRTVGVVNTAMTTLFGVKWTILKAKVFASVNMVIKSIGRLALTIVRQTAKMIASLARMAARAAVSFAKMVAKAAWAALRMAGHMAKMAAKYAWLAVRSLAAAARIAASWFIALGPIGWVIGAVVGLVALIIWKWEEIVKWTKWLWNKVTGFLEGIDLVGIGEDIMQGLLNGISNMAGAIWNKVEEIASGVKDAITGFFSISSPSKVMTYMGEMLGLGLARGIEGMTRTVGKATDKLTGAAAMPALGGVALGGVSPAGAYEPKPIRRGGHTRNIRESNERSAETNEKTFALLTSIERAIRENRDVYIDGRRAGDVLEPHVSRAQKKSIDITKTRRGQRP